MDRLRQTLLALSVAIVLVGCVPVMQTQTLTVGTGTITAEVVSTPELMAKGLSGRASLGRDRGMLFLYEDPTIPQFWMKGMNFSIDIIWLRNNKIVGIDQRLPTDDGAVRYVPPSEIDAVLELSSGTAVSVGLKVGDTIHYSS